VEELRPLTLGEIIDRAVSFWRRRWRPMFVLYLGFALGGYAIYKGGRLIVDARFPAARELFFAADLRALAGAGQHLDELLGGAAVMSASLWLYMLVGAIGSVAVTRYAMLTYLGQAIKPGEALRESAVRAPRTLGLLVMQTMWTLLVIALAMVPGVGLIALGVRAENAAGALGGVLGLFLAFAGAGVAVLWSILRFFLTSQLVAMEDLPLWRLFVRSGQLTSGRVAPGFGGLVKVRLTVLLTVMGIVLMLVSLIGGLPQIVLQVLYSPSLGRLSDTYVPAALLVPAELLDTVFTAVITPIYVVFQTLVYVDVRVRREGLDLKLKLSSAAEALKAA